MDAGYTIRINQRDGVVESVVRRACDAHEIAEYERLLLPIATQARDRLGRLRLLVDSRAAGPLPTASVERLMVLEERLVRRADDRIAILVDSSLSKAQLAAGSRHRQINRFLSESAARTWLSAFDEDRTAPAVRVAGRAR